MFSIVTMLHQTDVQQAKKLNPNRKLMRFFRVHLIKIICLDYQPAEVRVEELKMLRKSKQKNQEKESE